MLSDFIQNKTETIIGSSHQLRMNHQALHSDSALPAKCMIGTVCFCKTRHNNCRNNVNRSCEDVSDMCRRSAALLPRWPLGSSCFPPVQQPLVYPPPGSHGERCVGEDGSSGVTWQAAARRSRSHGYGGGRVLTRANRNSPQNNSR